MSDPDLLTVNLENALGRSGNKTAPTSDILGICGDITVVTNKT